MYRRNTAHLQPPLQSTVDELPVKQRERLEDSWAGTFYRDFFARINEDTFAGLYSGKPSRPNVGVNVLVAFEVLKAGHGWSDAEAYDAICYNLQVRYAVGIRDMSTEVFTLRTVYNFRRAVTDRMAETGENLFESVFNQVTGEQLKAYELHSTRLRTDSTQVASNIRNLSRLQLLVEVLQHVYRMLDAEDQEKYGSQFEPYLRGSSGQYAYHMRGEEPREQLNEIGQLMARLVTDLEARYGSHDAFGVLRRVLGEQFAVAGSLVNRRPDEDVSAKSLQSPDDPDATYRRRGGEGHRGYVANLTETCDDDNDAQLIVHVAVESNSVDDAQMLAEAVPDLVRSTEVQELYTDGGYNSPQVDARLREHGVTQYQTAIRGRARHAGMGPADFDWHVDDQARPTSVTCPGSQTVDLIPGRQPHRFVARFPETACAQCPLQAQCPATPLQRSPARTLRISQRQVDLARRIRRCEALRAGPQNPRASVEATVWSVKCHLPRNRVPVRTKPRVSMYLFAAVFMHNIRRLTGLTTSIGRNPQPSERPRLCHLSVITAIKQVWHAVCRTWPTGDTTRRVSDLRLSESAS